jgi:two-component system, chemotaxis family, protein-glutamate methylesterase/glutaminase
MNSGPVGNAAQMSPPRGVLAIGGSAGGVEALMEVVARLPAQLPAPVLVTVHIGSNARSNLPQILARSGPLPAAQVRHGETLRPGHIYVAPPDFHLLAGGGVARLSSGPRVNRHRPAIDVMFASAARWAGDRLVAVVLSGVLDDGAVGAALVARAGGRVVVQDPAEALFDSMPRSALAAAPSAVVVPSNRLAEAVEEALALTDERPRGKDQDEGGAVTDQMRMADSDDPAFLRADESRLVRLSCPDCSGGLAGIHLGGVRYYRCHVGHQYSPLSLEAAQREAVETKLWAAAAALEEHAALARHLATSVDATLGDEAADGYRAEADRSTDAARALLARLQSRRPATPPADPGGNGEPRRAG